MSEIRMLRTFLAIEKHGTMAAAADRMALTHAAVGAQMRTLERVCQRQLFDRSGRSIQLNEAGRSIIQQARTVVAAYDSLLRGVADELSIEGSITIGSTVSSMGFLAANVIRLRVSYPGLKVRLTHGNSGELERQVRAGEIDAAVIISEPRATTLPESWERLYDEPLVLLVNPAIGPPDASVASLLKRHPFIGFEAASLTGTHVASLLRRLRVEVNPILEMNSIAAIADLVRQNVGVSIVPRLRHAAWDEDPLLSVRPIPGTAWRRHIGWYEFGRQPLATAIVKNQLLAALAE
ncbi:LysR family transcriptional regulator [Paraburkholderia caffeinilytica]|uniref:LysR family transcriptional regulator n=1 Tax=Paraburkholderia caffeinilytica TaxID=1761016 RepID=A0ABQ1NB33_9BURK|nr:LysR family transcriptional regulator [Paraburkholderia caffeinilytica]AXL50837.1 LysR family transcriptional regulator [Paraburkholderia caffeinilytica]GGC66439.1 LysR family transcriptional regulator [Paraburkholderia caffeinilytica]CAB3803703.1 HTH-type transcriptional activator CmpR [Paraburkholderia caffeinilytica]